MTELQLALATTLLLIAAAIAVGVALNWGSWRE